MKIKIYVLNTCITDENHPCHPEVFTSYDAAEAVAEERLRAEWEHNAPCDDDGEPLPYPGNWREANNEISAENPEWGQWELTSHEITAPDPEVSIILEGGIVQDVVTADERILGMPYRVIDYDTDGADEADLYGIPQEDGSLSDAYVGGGSVSLATINLAGIKPLSEFDAEEETA